MQLTILYVLLFVFFLSKELKAKASEYYVFGGGPSLDSDTSKVEVVAFEKPDWKPIEFNFLTSYYVQDGDNSPVTGGIGTEFLTDFTQKISLKVPIKETLDFNLDAGYDYYTSASTDNIDALRSDDSAADMRSHGGLGLTYTLPRNQQVGFRIGTSVEYDYTSISLGGNYLISSPSANTSLFLTAQTFLDQWKLIYPVELRKTESLSQKNRFSFNASASLSQVLSKRIQFSLQAEVIYMQGLLSTPFHRVFLENQETAVLELLPGTRLKIPLGARLNMHVSERLITRMSYRYYWDDWGITAHTLSLELPIKVNRFLAIYPHVRYHTQTSANYFQPYQKHTGDSQFRSSDYDLSALSSMHYGIGIQYQPAGGLWNAKIPYTGGRMFSLDGIDLKFSHFERSNGLRANIVSLGFKMKL